MPQRTDLFHSTILYSNDLEDIHLSTIKILISKEDNDESVREENERKTDPIMQRWDDRRDFLNEKYFLFIYFLRFIKLQKYGNICGKKDFKVKLYLFVFMLNLNSIRKSWTLGRFMVMHSEKMLWLGFGVVWKWCPYLAPLPLPL